MASEMTIIKLTREEAARYRAEQAMSPPISGDRSLVSPADLLDNADSRREADPEWCKLTHLPRTHWEFQAMHDDARTEAFDRQKRFTITNMGKEDKAEFPSRSWICRLCGVANFPSHVHCSGLLHPYYRRDAVAAIFGEEHRGWAMSFNNDIVQCIGSQSLSWGGLLHRTGHKRKVPKAPVVRLTRCARGTDFRMRELCEIYRSLALTGPLHPQEQKLLKDKIKEMKLTRRNKKARHSIKVMTRKFLKNREKKAMEKGRPRHAGLQLMLFRTLRTSRGEIGKGKFWRCHSCTELKESAFRAEDVF